MSVDTKQINECGYKQINECGYKQIYECGYKHNRTSWSGGMIMV